MKLNLREIDRLVAEEVMRYNLSGLSHLTTPYFSTNIADAWRVVEKLYKDKGLRMFVGLDFPPLYMARLKDDKGDWIGHGAEAETAPLAICLAALKVCGIEVGGTE